MMIMKKIAALISAATLLLFASCSDGGGSSSSDTAALTAVEITGNSSVSVGKTITLTAKATKTGSPSITYTWSIDPASTGSTLSATSGESVTLTAGSTTGSVKVSLSATDGTNTKTAEKTITVSTQPSLNLSDTPTGYASLGSGYITSSSGATTVTTRSELLTAVANGGVIIIDGMIDMSEGKLPDTGKTSLTVSTKLDEFVRSTNSSYSSYTDWVEKYSEACSANTEDGDSKSSYKSELYSALWALNVAYGNLIKLNIKANTTLVGKTSDCGIRGGTIQIGSTASNIIIRNLTIQDAVDPFPHHEQKNTTTSDGFNAQWDGICIDGAKNIWIDHCTFEDTLTLDYAPKGTKEKWQVYDGLCDMKNGCTNITVSNCVFKNHDKTMLIGSSDSDGSNTERFVTISGNHFLNCGQRLPMVRNSIVHVYNNYYVTSGSPYSSTSCVNARKNAIVYAENNYFDSGCKDSFSAASGDSTPVLHASGNEGSTANKTNNITVADSTLFSTLNKYTYSAVSAEEAKANATSSSSWAGAGYLLNY